MNKKQITQNNKNNIKKNVLYILYSFSKKYRNTAPKTPRVSMFEGLVRFEP